MKIFKSKNTLKIGIVALVFTASVLIFTSFKDNSFEVSKNLDIFYTLFRELNLYYVDETDPGELVKDGIDAMLESLDPYTVYIPESRMEDYQLMTTGSYGGIGAIIRQSGDYVAIIEPYEASPAVKAGLQAGDLIMSIDGKSIKGKTSSDVSDLLKGQPNSVLKLEIKRPGSENPANYEITREKIQLSNVPYYGLINDKTGYIILTGFTEKAGQEVKKALIELKEKHKIESVILDLRGNPGGLLNEAVVISNLFVNKGQEVVSTKGKVKQWDKVYLATDDPVDIKIPVVVLVNSGSASASEIVSGSLQDLDRAVIIGTRTFGKGLVQITRDLSYNSKLKLTTAKYYIPSGRCIQALDYSHRNEDGSVGKVPDSLITEFKTLHGRKVFDGGGIVPDIATEPERISNISVSLITKDLIFEYATLYKLKHPVIASAREFSISEEDYIGFVQFLATKDFDYKTNSEDKLNQLIETAKREKYYEKSTDEFENLRKLLAHDKNKDLLTFKDEIVGLLNQEIVSRYYYQKGRIENSLSSDKDIKEAVNLLSDPLKYNEILGMKN